MNLKSLPDIDLLQLKANENEKLARTKNAISNIDAELKNRELKNATRIAHALINGSSEEASKLASAEKLRLANLKKSPLPSKAKPKPKPKQISVIPSAPILKPASSPLPVQPQK